jgi:tryptophanyl-tRNA synthetase
MLVGLETSMEVTVFGVHASSKKGVDYEKLLVRFGCIARKDDYKAKILNLTGAKPHRLTRRNIFFCHRDLDIILNRFEQGKAVLSLHRKMAIS